MISEPKPFVAICETDPLSQRLLSVYCHKLGYLTVCGFYPERLINYLEDEWIQPLGMFMHTRERVDPILKLLQCRLGSGKTFLRIPLIAVTTYVCPVYERTLYESGVYAILRKPYLGEDVEKVLRGLLRASA